MDEPVQEQQPTSQTPILQPRFPKSHIFLLILFTVIGISVGFFIGKSFNQTPTTNVTPSVLPTKIVESTQTVRPTDQIVNGKKQYRTQGFGMTFEYPVEWNVTEESINPNDDRIENTVQISNLFIGVNQDRDGAGGAKETIKTYSKENVLIDNIPAVIIVEDACLPVRTLEGGFSETNPSCKETMRMIKTAIIQNSNEWVFGLSVDTNEESLESALRTFKEIVSTIKFTD